jgi:hypothetical protein
MSCVLVSDISPARGYAVIAKSYHSKGYVVKYLDDDLSTNSSVKTIEFKSCTRTKDINKIINVIINMMGLSIMSDNIFIDINKYKPMGSQTVHKIPFGDGSYVVAKHITLPQTATINYQGYGLVAEVKGIVVDKNSNRHILMNMFYKPVITYQSIRRALIKMHAMHMNGVYHGDCHAGNIMMDKNAELILVDPVCLLNGNPTYRNASYIGKDQFKQDVVMFVRSCTEIFAKSNDIADIQKVSVKDDELFHDLENRYSPFLDILSHDSILDMLTNFRVKIKPMIEVETELSSIASNDSSDNENADFKDY